MKKMISLLVVLGFLSGCSQSPSNVDKAQSQVNVMANGWNKGEREQFLDKGKTTAFDPWGHEITWDIAVGTFADSFYLSVRSNGPDGLMFTKDDIVARRSYKMEKLPPEFGRAVEANIQAATRGAAKGLKEGLLGKSPEKPEEKK